MFDLTRVRYFLTAEVPVVPAAVIANEGGVLKSVRISGVEHAQLTEGIAAEAICGFAINSNIVPGEEVVYESMEIPADSVVKLTRSLLVAGQIRVYHVEGAAALTVITSGNPTAGQVKVDYVRGELTLHATLAAANLQVRYRYQMTATEQMMKFGGRPVNGGANTAQGTITYARGNGNWFCDQYDVTVDFSAATALYADANGLITTTAGDNTVIPGARVINVPSAADPFLGFTFNLA